MRKDFSCGRSVKNAVNAAIAQMSANSSRLWVGIISWGRSQNRSAATSTIKAMAVAMTLNMREGLIVAETAMDIRVRRENYALFRMNDGTARK